jgi:hypothetical protein
MILKEIPYEEKIESYDIKNIMKNFNRIPDYQILKDHYEDYKENSFNE